MKQHSLLSRVCSNDRMRAIAVKHVSEGNVVGHLHAPAASPIGGLVLTHGAGANCQAPLLAAVAEELTAAGLAVLRYELPFRQRRRFGPPSPSTAAEDRAGLRAAVEWMRQMQHGPVYLGGHSYGGRQASMLAADEFGFAKMLLLLSYPLHPPDKPWQMRTGHFAELRTPALLVQGSKDPFGSEEEMRAALRMTPAKTEISIVGGAGHDLGRDKRAVARTVAAAFVNMAAGI